MLPQLPRSATGVGVLIELAAEHGVPARRLLAGTGIAEATLADPAAEIAPSAELAVITNLLAELGDLPGLGLQAGHRYHVGLFGIWGFALMTSPTVRDALEVAVRFVDLTFSFSRLQLTVTPTEARLAFDDTGVPAQLRSFLLERDIGSAARLLQDVLREPPPGLELELALPHSTDPAPWQAATGVTPTFGAARHQVVLPATVLTTPLPQANLVVTTATQEQCAAVLRARRERVGIAGQVRRVLLTGPPAQFRQEDVAAAVHQSPRTLHRRLAEEGTTYRELVTETTVLLAQELLGAGLTVEATASRLGYAGAPAFTVAFRKATGTTPGAWARTQRR